jgi:carbonyl reductase 1
LAKSGKFTVLLAARDPQRGEEAVKKINEENGTDHVKFIHLDVTNDEIVSKLPQNILQKTQNKQLDVLINNAGYATKGSVFNQQIAQQTIDVNYYGVKRVTDTLLKENLIVNDGRIINVSSRAGQIGSSNFTTLKKVLDHPTRNQVDDIVQNFIQDAADPDTIESKGWPKNTYKVSKAALNAYTGILANEQQGKVHVFSYCPGWCVTNMGGPNAVHTAEEGADTGVWLATEDLNKLKTGHFYAERKEIHF